MTPFAGEDVGSRRAVEAQLKEEFDCICKKTSKLRHTNNCRHLGALGGNHFVEVYLDETGFVRLMLHSGSRGGAKGDCQALRCTYGGGELSPLCAEGGAFLA